MNMFKKLFNRNNTNTIIPIPSDTEVKNKKNTKSKIEKGQIWKFAPNQDSPFPNTGNNHEVEILGYKNGWVNYRFCSSTNSFQNEATTEGSFRNMYILLNNELGRNTDTPKNNIKGKDD